MTKYFRSVATVIALLVGLAGVGLTLYAWQLPPFSSAVEATNNAYVRGQVTILAPQLSGYVSTVEVQDFQQVEAGALLVRLDDGVYRQRLLQAQATLAAQRAALANWEQTRRSKEAAIAYAKAAQASAEAAARTAEAAHHRNTQLFEREVVTQSDVDKSGVTLDQAQAALDQARAGVEQAEQDLAATIGAKASLEAAVDNAYAAVQLAEIDLRNTEIRAPQAGTLGEVGARLGQYVTAGTQLVALVPQRMWVIANFKETQVAKLRPGQSVTLRVDALPGVTLKGHIARFAPATGSEFSVLRADNATGNFTKIAQRLPVHISIDPDQGAAARLAPGMSVFVTVDTDAPVDALYLAKT